MGGVDAGDGWLELDFAQELPPPDAKQEVVELVAIEDAKQPNAQQGLPDPVQAPTSDAEVRAESPGTEEAKSEEAKSEVAKSEEAKSEEAKSEQASAAQVSVSRSRKKKLSRKSRSRGRS